MAPRTPNEFSDHGNLSSLMLSVIVRAATGMDTLSYAWENLPVNARESGIFRSHKINGVPTSLILVMPALTAILLV